MLKQFFLSERSMLIAILLNSMIIWLLYFPQIENNDPGFYTILENIDHLFVLLFIVEALVKIKVMGRKNYFGNNWNVFDFVIMLISIPSLLSFLPLFAKHSFSFVKILRLFRVIRLLRVVSFIPRMESILAGLGRALKASVFVILALFFLNFLISLFTCHLYGKLAPDYFGDPLISSYYIFQMFTVEGWNEIPQIIADAANDNGVENAYLIAGITRFYFVIIVLMGGVFGMSLANAIFVDEMTMDNNKELEDKIDILMQKVDALNQKLNKEEE